MNHCHLFGVYNTDIPQKIVAYVIYHFFTVQCNFMPAFCRSYTDGSYQKALCNISQSHIPSV